ncbi:putative nucleotidyltransferase [Oxalobacteraceae bacterium GrIS 2.11]
MNNLPEDVEKCVEIFVDSARQAFGADLVSVVLFGSAATGELRATSDVNLLLVTTRFEQRCADMIRDPLRLAHAAVQLNVMFLLEDEVADAVEAFAVKFADIVTRHRVLIGPDPFINLSVSRQARLRRLDQVLLNLQLRLRERYVSLSLREEQLAHFIADAAPPLRSSAASILQLEGHGELAGKLALEQIVAESSHPDFQSILHNVSEAREQGHLAQGTAPATAMNLMQLTRYLRERAARIQ